MARIYTRTGDKGSTGLYDGSRARKSHPVFEALGDIDELNAQIGWAMTEMTGPGHIWLREVQDHLIRIGSDLGTPMDSNRQVDRIDGRLAVLLEGWIDQCEESLEPLKTFIRPGGTRASAALHVARTVCRRAERSVVQLIDADVASGDPLPNEHILIYLNRLSDLLFDLARWFNERETH